MTTLAQWGVGAIADTRTMFEGKVGRMAEEREGIDRLVIRVQHQR